MENAQEATQDTSAASRQRQSGNEFSTVRARDAIGASLQKIVAEGEELLRMTANYSAESLATARDALQSNLEHAKARLAETRALVNDQTYRATTATQEYIIKNPWRAVAIAGSVGFSIGLLMRRRNHH
ncbi:MAG: DUF883 family protein [Pseudomonadota bacterium]